jgi:uncharacterized membrane protein YdfJ with MMPL/SSD domain
MLPRLVRLVTTRPRRLAVAAVVFVLVAGVLGGPVAGLLSTSSDSFEDPGSDSVAARERVERATGVDAATSIVVLVRPGADVRSPAGRAALARIEREVRAVPGVARTASVAGTGSPAFVSRDGRASYIAVSASAKDDAADVGQRVEDALAGERGVQVGGTAVAGPAIGDQVSQDLARAELLAFPLLFLLSIWAFRGVVAALMPLMVGIITILGTFLGLRLINEAVHLSVFALNLTTALGLGLAVDYALFVVTRYREEVAGGLDRGAAIAVTLRTAGRTILFSSLTVAAALLALLVFPQRFLYSMGVAGALTALIAVAVSLTVLPAVLVLLGPRIDALALRRRGGPEPGSEQGGWYRLARAVMRRPLPIALATAALLIAVGLPFSGIRFTGVDATVLPKDATPRIVDTALRTEFPAGRTDPVLVAVRAPQSAGARLQAYADRLGALPGAAGADAPRRLGDDTWRIDVFPAAPVLDDRTLDLVDAVRSTPAPGDALVGGDSAAFVDQQAALGSRLPVALAILGVTTLVILFAMTGSVVLPVKALVMNLLTLSAAFGLLVLVFQDGRLEGLLNYTSAGALDSTQPLVLLCVAFGLSTDYGVFLLARIKEARDAGLPTERAVALGLARTGRIVTAAALLLTVALGAFATSEIIFIKEVGLGTAAAVLIDATIVRALLVPSLMRLLGEWNWWAPRRLRRLVVAHEHV